MLETLLILSQCEDLTTMTQRSKKSDTATKHNHAEASWLIPISIAVIQTIDSMLRCYAAIKTTSWKSDKVTVTLFMGGFGRRKRG